MGSVLLIALIVFWCLKLNNKIALIVRCVLTGVVVPLYIYVSVLMFQLASIEVEGATFYNIFGVVFIILSLALVVRFVFDIRKIRRIKNDNDIG